MKVFKIITITILIIGLLFYSFVVTICLQKEYDKGEDLKVKLEKQYARNEELRLIIDELTGFTDTTLSQAIAWIEESIRSHEEYLENPHWCINIETENMTIEMGSLEFHQKCVDKYNRVLEVLRYYGVEISITD